MKLQLIPSLGEAAQASFAGKTAIVIDTLRATSNMAAAMASGVGEIIPVETVEEVQALYQSGDIRGGERGCLPIPGFELGNSPEDYERSELRGKRILMTTTNGTRAIRAAAGADRVFAASLLNARACAEAVRSEARDVVLLCSGTKDIFCAEDGLAAGAVLMEILRLVRIAERETECGMDDCCRVMLGYFEANRDDLEAALFRCDSGIRLSGLGLGRDVWYCSRLNRFASLPYLSGGTLIPWPGSSSSVRPPS